MLHPQVLDVNASAVGGEGLLRPHEVVLVVLVVQLLILLRVRVKAPEVVLPLLYSQPFAVLVSPWSLLALLVLPRPLLLLHLPIVFLSLALLLVDALVYASDLFLHLLYQTLELLPPLLLHLIVLLFHLIRYSVIYVLEYLKHTCALLGTAVKDVLSLAFTL